MSEMAVNKLAALAWAAGQAGVSYGKFVRGLFESDVERICREYAAWRAEHDRKMVAKARENREAAENCRGKQKHIPWDIPIEDA